MSDEYSFSEGVFYHASARVAESAKVAPMSVIGAPPLNLDIQGGHRVRKPEVGGVRLCEGVDVGSNVTVVRGTYKDTTLEHHVFVGHNVTIGHDCMVGHNCIIATGVHLMGEAVIEPWCYIGPGSVVQPTVRVLEGTRIGAFSHLIRNHYDVPAWSVAWGNPCKFIRPNPWRPPA
jgi:UDP-3-O-[3-hydroxymyristoyl] glucosamine N-acyltransferase